MQGFNYLRFLEASSLETSTLWLWGIPYDGTTSSRPGARFGPDEIRAASQWIESYSPYQKADLRDIRFYDAGNLDISFSSPEKVVEEVRSFSSTLFRDGKRSLMIGGEHSASFPIVQAASLEHEGLRLFDFDAHCDMREDYGGQRFSHASVMRRVLEVLPPERVAALGIRSGDRDEFLYAEKLPRFHPFTLAGIEQVVRSIPPSAPLYVTIDLDILDPAFFPGTGSPEPMGVSVSELHRALLALRGCNIVGADIVELAPNYDRTGASAAAAAFLVREMLLLMGVSK